jgi:hypothetical protein
VVERERCVKGPEEAKAIELVAKEAKEFAHTLPTIVNCDQLDHIYLLDTHAQNGSTPRLDRPPAFLSDQLQVVIKTASNRSR